MTPPPPSKPVKLNIFTWIDRFLPQFNGALKASQGKIGLTKQDVMQMLAETKNKSDWKPAATVGEETMTARLEQVQFGERLYSCTITATALQKEGTLKQIEFVLRDLEQQELAPVEDFTHLATTRYGEPTSTYEDEDGAEWEFSDGLLSMWVERAGDEGSLPGESSKLTFSLEPFAPQSKPFEKDVNRSRD
ncbi:MAG: hypothetical protein K1Y36_26960 [Blastocatellia bacterium]|nr:hypothetical protein [Blastocatellia bacterium]